MKNLKITLPILLILIISLSVGYFVGYRVKSREVELKTADLNRRLEEFDELEKRAEVGDKLKSPLISLIVASGRVKEISEKSVVLIPVMGEGIFEFLVDKDTDLIFSGEEVFKEKLEDIQVDDFLSVNLEILEGEIKTKTVRVIPKPKER